MILQGFSNQQIFTPSIKLMQFFEDFIIKNLLKNETKFIKSVNSLISFNSEPNYRIKDDLIDNSVKIFFNSLKENRNPEFVVECFKIIVKKDVRLDSDQ